MHSDNEKANIIFVMSHKKNNSKLLPGYEFMQLNAESNNKFENYVFFDNMLNDNISKKNFSFCELTGLYTIWKNGNIKINNVGLVHYRRFFYNPFLSLTKPKIYSIEKLNKHLKKFDMIIPTYSNFRDKNRKKISVYEQYDQNHHISDLNEAVNIILNMYPEYHDTIISFLNNDKAVFFNMFYAPKNIINKYCEWLFPILFDLEERLDLSSYDDKQKRVFGFISERLFNIWIIHNKYKVKMLAVCNTEDFSFIKNIKQIIKQVIYRRLY